MKSRLLIIIGVIIVLGTMSIVIVGIYQGQIEWKEKVGGLRDSDHQFQLVLDYCEEKKEGHDMNLIGLYYYNETHYIDNNKYQWELLENYPNSDRLCIPHSSQSYTDEEIRNDTHIYNKQTCQWGIEFSWYDEYSRDAMDNIRIHGNNDGGITPSLLKYCIDGGKSDGFTINNSTHHFNFETCTWQERKVVHTTPFGYPRDTTGNYDHCFSYKTDPEYGVKIQNSTHILNLENCEWELENEK